MSTIWGFDHIENKHTLYCGKDCIKKFCTSLREHTKNIIDFEKKKMLPLTKEELKLYKIQKYVIFVEKESQSLLKKTIEKSEIIVIIQVLSRGAAHNICNIKFTVSNEIPAVFHNGSNYDYHFIIKGLGNEFEGQFECLGENTEKYKTFSVLIENQGTKADEDGSESIETISYK